jgi:hypothetical protein
MRKFNHDGDLPAFSIDVSPDATSLELSESTYKALAERYRQVIDWYLVEKEKKKRASKAIRAIAWVLAVAGGLIPLLVGAGLEYVDPSLGYVFLASAASIQLVDRYFGYSESWKRYVSVAMECSAGLLAMQVGWLELKAMGDRVELVAGQWSVLRDHTAKLNEAITGETDHWKTDLEGGIDELRTHVSSSG